MAISKAAHADLSTRILALVAEYAAASDRRGAEAKASVILEGVSVSDTDAGPSEKEGLALVAEINRRGEQLEALRDSKQVIVDQLEGTLKELAETKAALAEAKGMVDEAKGMVDELTAPKDQA